jgi:hypothetical protein
MKTLLWGIWLSALVGSQPAAGQPGPVLQFSGLSTLNLNLADRDGLERNEQRRGDSPFSNLQMTLFGDVAFAPRLALFTQLLIDPSGRASQSLSTYLNSYLRYTGRRFSKIDDGASGQTAWDYDVDRWEAGLSYPLYEGVLGKLAWQHTRLDQPGAEGFEVRTLQITSSF